MECIWDTFDQISLHGWKYIGQKYTLSTRILWLIILLLGVLASTFFIYSSIQDFRHATVATEVDSMMVPLKEVFFPSVVICNNNQERHSYHRSITELQKTGNIDYSIGAKNDTLWTPLWWTKYQQCKDLHLLSKWNRSTVYEFEVPREFGTDYGTCCWYTPQLNLTQIVLEKDPEGEIDWPNYMVNLPKGAKRGINNGYTLLLDIESFDYGCNEDISEGVKVAVTHHLDMPLMQMTSFQLAPGTENLVQVTPTLHSTSRDALYRFTPQERDCYTNDEAHLSYLPGEYCYRYELNNCLFDAAYGKILEHCQCNPEHTNMVRKNDEFVICNETEQKHCSDDILNKLGYWDYFNDRGQSKKCLSACEDQKNSIGLSHSVYPSRTSFSHGEVFCILAERLLQKCNGYKRVELEIRYPDICREIKMEQTKLKQICEKTNGTSTTFNDFNISKNTTNVLLHYARENVIKINIFMNDQYVTRYIKAEKMSRTKIIANCVQILVMFMGFSFIAGIEVLYHLFTGLFVCIKKLSKKSPDL